MEFIERNEIVKELEEFEREFEREEIMGMNFLYYFFLFYIIYFIYLIHHYHDCKKTNTKQTPEK